MKFSQFVTAANSLVENEQMIQKHMDAFHKKVQGYNAGQVGADSLGDHAVKTIKKIAKYIGHDAAQKMVWDHTDKHIKESLTEEIKGWKNAHSDLMKFRAAAGSADHSVALHRLRSDGKESGMSDARRTFASEADAHAHVANAKKLNPGKVFKYNKYVNGQHVGVVNSEEH